MQLIVLGQSYNQPRFSSCASWNSNGITFANSSTINPSPTGIFVNINNTIYVASRYNGSIQVWDEHSITPMTTISGSLNEPHSLFVTIDGDIYVDNGWSHGRIDKWTQNATNSVTVMNVDGPCGGLFVDINNYLYCSLYYQHTVVKQSLNISVSTSPIVAGSNAEGSASNMLSYPHGIFVTINLDLYVADCNNHRVQLFKFGEINGTTVAINIATVIIELQCPTGVILDADGYLFITDRYNNRIIGEAVDGFRCLIGCSGESGSTSDKLSLPFAAAFDRYGNIFVTDHDNNRVQKFTLTTNLCGE
jgi:hypothetical protein